MVRADAVLSSGPFSGVDLAMLPAATRMTIEQASEDFERVLAGQPPKHARLDKEVPLPADGGTQFYNGTGYQLTIIKRLAVLSGAEEQAHVDGYLYGPVIRLEGRILAGHDQTISAVRFYTAEQMRQLQRTE